MLRRPGTLLLLAVVIGALGAALVYRQLRSLRSEIESARQAPDSTVDVVVANQTIPLGTRIAAKSVKVVAWPRDIAPEGAISDPKAVVDSVARMTIDKNQPLNQSQLLSEGEGLLPTMIPEGMRAMSVKVDDVTGVSGFITPNSRVDVLVAGASGEGGGEGGQQQRSKLVLQDIKVLAIGKSIEQRDEKAVEVPTVTLLVSPDQAEKLTLAARYEPVRLALRNYGDGGLVGTPGISTATLFETPARRPAPPAAAPPQTPRPAPEVKRERRPRHSVEVLLGEKVTRQDLF
jgi:pilus assembly protein CpaB